MSDEAKRWRRAHDGLWVLFIIAVVVFGMQLGNALQSSLRADDRSWTVWTQLWFYLWPVVEVAQIVAVWWLFRLPAAGPAARRFLGAALGLSAAVALVAVVSRAHRIGGDGSGKESDGFWPVWRQLSTYVFHGEGLLMAFVPWVVARAVGIRGHKWLLGAAIVVVSINQLTIPLIQTFTENDSISFEVRAPYYKLSTLLSIAASVLALVVAAWPVLLWSRRRGQIDASGWRAASRGLNVLRWELLLRFGVIIAGMTLHFVWPVADADSYQAQSRFWIQTVPFQTALICLGPIQLAGLALYRQIKSPDDAGQRAEAAFRWIVGSFILSTAFAVGLPKGMHTFLDRSFPDVWEHALQFALVIPLLAGLGSLRGLAWLARSFQSAAGASGALEASYRAGDIPMRLWLIVAIGVGMIALFWAGFPPMFLLLGFGVAGVLGLVVAVSLLLIMSSLHASLRVSDDVSPTAAID
jgi:hypothetical protein